MKTDRNPAGAAPIGVLICDDNPEIRTILTEIIGLEPSLRVLGHACDGNEVIAKARLLKPDVIILDLAMPNRSGLDALLELALAAPSAKTIVLSVYVAPSVVQEAMQRGAVGYVEKGNGMIDELLGAIVTAVETAPAAPAEQNGGRAGPADPALEERGPSAAASMKRRNVG